MPTLDTNASWRSTSEWFEDQVTLVDWPVVVGGYLTSTDFETVATSRDYPTTTVGPTVITEPPPSDSARVRAAVRRAVAEFGPAFDRLGGT